ncbi:MAG TPA: chitobiase/beta-hexosaminidase C-terminal domain-containing protein, partial [Nocardioides sp.]|nr:chitobiase/beta-hexosaminidase C-terminal domain-containing protein [Nocardioides sp.]
TLQYVVRAGGQESELYTEEYDVRSGLPTVTAAPVPAAAGAVLEGRQDVVLTSSMPGQIFYTTDGTRPQISDSEELLGSTLEYTEPITFARSTIVRAFALADPVEAPPVEPAPVEPPLEEPAPPAPQAGAVKTFPYVIHNLRAVSPEKTFGYPFSLTDIGLPPATPGDPRENPVGLELCLDDPGCPVVGDLPDPTRGLSFPDNFPDESFWWSGEAQLDLPNGRARLILALEAAFDSPTVQDGHQVAFGRIRVRMDDMVPLATYEIVHPYGVIRATADDRGRVFYTEDNGCMTGPCGFDALRAQPVGPVLRWTDGAPPGYLGDPTATHTVVGSPYDTNVFEVRQVTDGGGQAISPVLVGETDQFTVQGKLPGPGAIASWQTGLFNRQLDVTLSSGGNPLTQGFRYTTDSTDPVTNGQEYDGPIHIEDGTTVLRYVAVGADGQTSAVEEETYTIDSIAPTLTASPAGGAFDTAQEVTLQANELADIFFTLDGSTPTQTSPRALGPVRVASSSTLKAIAVDFAGNVSPVRSWDFTITPAPTGDGGTGTGGTGTGGTGTGGTATGGTGTGGTGTPAGPAATALVVQPTTVGPVDAGGVTTFSGVLAVNGQALTGAPVVLQTRALVAARPVFSGRASVGAGWVDIAATTTGAGGFYAFPSIRPTATADYRVVFRGDGTHGPVVSAVERIHVRGAVTLARKHHRVVERGTRMTLRGKLIPAHRGAIVLVKLDGPGRHADRVRATVTRRGTWKVTFRAPARTGRWTAVATWRGDVDHLGSSSAARTIRVVR